MNVFLSLFFFTLVRLCADLRAAFAKKVQKTVAMAKLFEECDGMNATQKQCFAGTL